MSAITEIIRKEEISYNTAEKSRLVCETIIWEKDGSDFALDCLDLIGDSNNGLVYLDDLKVFASDYEVDDLKVLVEEELKRDNLDSTDYEVVISS